MMTVLLAAWPAVAQSGRHDAPGSQDPARPGARRGERMDPPPGRPMMAPRDAAMPGRPPMERMTPDERRQLRQDINRHGREVYRGRREPDKE
jgi:hypothetical protein